MDETHEGATAVAARPDTEEPGKPYQPTPEEHKERMDFFHALLDKLPHHEKKGAEASLQKMAEGSYPMQEAAGNSQQGTSEEPKQEAAHDVKEEAKLPGLDVAMARYEETMRQMLGERQKAEQTYGKPQQKITSRSSVIAGRFMKFKTMFLKTFARVASLAGGR